MGLVCACCQTKLLQLLALFCFHLFTDILGKILGEESFKAGFKTIFDGLQCPKLNKHVSLSVFFFNLNHPL